MKAVILIDNNKDNLQFIKEAFASIDADIQCLSFVFVDEATTAVINSFVQRPDVIIMNLNMRGQNGLKWLMALRSNSQFDDIPVILYAPKISEHIITTVKDFGVTLTFEKPNTLREWKMKMREIFMSLPNSDVDLEPLFTESSQPVYSL